MVPVLNVLVTGGAGYLGSVLVGYLLSAGFHVVVVDNLMYKNGNSLMQYARHPFFVFIYGNVTDDMIMRTVVQDADVVIPMAAYVGQPICDRVGMNEVFGVNQSAISSMCDYIDDDTFVLYPNTNSGYGSRLDDVYCTEDAPLSPISIYGQAKANTEVELMVKHEKTISLRLATVFGPSPRMRIDLLINAFAWFAYRDNVIVVYEGDYMRNHIYVEDVAAAFVHCIKNRDIMKGGIFNLAARSGYTKIDIANVVAAVVGEFKGRDVHVIEKDTGVDPDKRNYVVSVDKLADTGFEAKDNLDFGVAMLVKTFPLMGQTWGNV